MDSLKTIEVAILHRDALTEQGLVSVLSREEDFQVRVGVSRDGADHALAAIGQLVVADYANAIAYLEREKRAPRTRHAAPAKVVILTQLDREWDVRRALNAGARGYLLQCCELSELVTGIRAVARGSKFLCSLVSTSVADSLVNESLTEREEHVLQLLTQGMANKEIARSLGIAVGTVKAHVRNVFGKLDAQSRTEAAAVATQRGIVSLERNSYRDQRALRATG